LETRKQVEDRIVAAHESEPLLFIDLICEDTIEEDILESLMLSEGEGELMKRCVRRLQKDSQIIAGRKVSK
jgi:hypothetical protein